MHVVAHVHELTPYVNDSLHTSLHAWVADRSGRRACLHCSVARAGDGGVEAVANGRAMLGYLEDPAMLARVVAMGGGGELVRLTVEVAARAGLEGSSPSSTTGASNTIAATERRRKILGFADEAVGTIAALCPSLLTGPTFAAAYLDVLRTTVSSQPLTAVRDVVAVLATALGACHEAVATLPVTGTRILVVLQDVLVGDGTPDDLQADIVYIFLKIAHAPTGDGVFSQLSARFYHTIIAALQYSSHRPLVLNVVALLNACIKDPVVFRALPLSETDGGVSLPKAVSRILLQRNHHVQSALLHLLSQLCRLYALAPLLTATPLPDYLLECLSPDDAELTVTTCELLALVHSESVKQDHALKLLHAVESVVDRGYAAVNHSETNVVVAVCGTLAALLDCVECRRHSGSDIRIRETVAKRLTTLLQMVVLGDGDCEEVPTLQISSGVRAMASCVRLRGLECSDLLRVAVEWFAQQSIPSHTHTSGGAGGGADAAPVDPPCCSEGGGSRSGGGGAPMDPSVLEGIIELLDAACDDPTLAPAAAAAAPAPALAALQHPAPSDAFLCSTLSLVCGVLGRSAGGAAGVFAPAILQPVLVRARHLPSKMQAAAGRCLQRCLGGYTFSSPPLWMDRTTRGWHHHALPEGSQEHVLAGDDQMLTDRTDHDDAPAVNHAVDGYLMRVVADAGGVWEPLDVGAWQGRGRVVEASLIQAAAAAVDLTLFDLDCSATPVFDPSAAGRVLWAFLAGVLVPQLQRQRQQPHGPGSNQPEIPASNTAASGLTITTAAAAVHALALICGSYDRTLPQRIPADGLVHALECLWGVCREYAVDDGVRRHVRKHLMREVAVGWLFEMLGSRSILWAVMRECADDAEGGAGTGFPEGNGRGRHQHPALVYSSYPEGAAAGLMGALEPLSSAPTGALAPTVIGAAAAGAARWAVAHGRSCAGDVIAGVGDGHAAGGGGRAALDGGTSDAPVSSILASTASTDLLLAVIRAETVAGVAVRPTIHALRQEILRAGVGGDGMPGDSIARGTGGDFVRPVGVMRVVAHLLTRDDVSSGDGGDTHSLGDHAGGPTTPAPSVSCDEFFAQYAAPLLQRALDALARGDVSPAARAACGLCLRVLRRCGGLPHTTCPSVLTSCLTNATLREEVLVRSSETRSAYLALLSATLDTDRGGGRRPNACDCALCPTLSVAHAIALPCALTAADAVLLCDVVRHACAGGAAVCHVDSDALARFVLDWWIRGDAAVRRACIAMLGSVPRVTRSALQAHPGMHWLQTTADAECEEVRALELVSYPGL